MNKVTVNHDKIVITYKSKKILKRKDKELLLKDIKFVTREDYKKDLFALTIFCKSGKSFYLDKNKFENLENIYSLLVKHCTDENNYDITIIDIYNMEETKVK